MWGWDRKICPEDHRFASQGLLNDDKWSSLGTIRIHHECEGRIEKSVLWMAKLHHEACRVMTNGDREIQIFFNPIHTNYGFFFLLTIKYLILYWKTHEKASRKSGIC